MFRYILTYLHCASFLLALLRESVVPVSVKTIGHQLYDVFISMKTCSTSA